MNKLRYQAVVNLYGNAQAGEIANETINSANPFKVNIDKDGDKPRRKNTMEDLKMLGVDINIHKDSNFTPISEMFKSIENPTNQ